MKKLLIIKILLILLAMSSSHDAYVWADSLNVDSTDIDDACGQYLSSSYPNNSNNSWGTCEYFILGNDEDSSCNVSNRLNWIRPFIKITNIGDIPAGKVIDSAFIYLYCHDYYVRPACSGAASMPYYPCRIMRNWAQGGACIAFSTGSVCWNDYSYPDSEWTIAGCNGVGTDRSDTAVYEQFVLTPDSEAVWIKIDIGDMVDEWYQGTYSNYGFTLVGLYNEADSLGKWKFRSTEYADTASQRPYGKIYYHTPNPPTLPKVTTWYSEQLSSSGYGYANPDTLTPKQLVDYSPQFSAVCAIDSCYYYQIQVGTSAGGSDIWNPGWAAFNDTFYTDERCSKITYGGSTLQCCIQYHWRIRFASTDGDTLDYCADQTFEGVTPEGWPDTTDIRADIASCTRRQNICLGTSHSVLGADKPIKVPFRTGYGEIIADNAMVNKAFHNGCTQIAYYDSFTYVAYLGVDTSTGYMGAYVIKRNHETGAWSSPYCVETNIDSVMNTDGDEHFMPQITIDPVEHKLHLMRRGHDGVQEHGAYYYRTTVGHVNGSGIDITNWTAVAEPAAFRQSAYSTPMTNSNGDLFISYRHRCDTSLGDPLASHLKRAAYCYAKLPYTGSGWGSWSDRKYIVYYHDYKLTPPSVYNVGAMIDNNDRMWVVVLWYDSYANLGYGRAISCMYSDIETSGADSGYYETWYELESQNPIGWTTDTLKADSTVDYAACSKITVCGTPDADTLTRMFLMGNGNGISLDGDNKPIIVYTEYDTLGQRRESDIYFVRWRNSSWEITNLTTEAGFDSYTIHHVSTPIVEGDKVYIYGMTKPDPGTRGEYFAAEPFVLRGSGLNTADTMAWVGEYLAANSGYGAGRINTYRYTPSGFRKAIVYSRGRKVIYWPDHLYGDFQRAGNDIHFVYYNGYTDTYYELPRVPVMAFQMDTSNNAGDIAAAFNYGNILANKNAPTNGVLQIYWSNPGSDSVFAEPDSIWGRYDNFENKPENTWIDSVDGWSGDSVKIFASISDSSLFTGAEINKVWAGDQFCVITGTYSACTLSVGTDVSNRNIYFHVWFGGGSGLISYVELLDTTANDYIRVGFPRNNGMFKYRSSDSSSWTDSDKEAMNARYHELKITIQDTDGVSAWVDGTTIVENDNTITVFDKLIIYGNYSQGNIFFDLVTIEKTVSDLPEITLTPLESIAGGRRSRVIDMQRRPR
ncbi:MAG: hypothetical protein J7K40_02085 [candidate division Zixibacteria bacterium]|nr:hypothetical protein [candidate division Zixibacteria bacterium]